MNIDEMQELVINNLSYAKVIKLLSLIEAESITEELFFDKVTKNSNQIKKILNISSIETTDLAYLVTTIQLELYKQLKRIANNTQNILEGDNGEYRPLFRNLQSLKFSFSDALNLSVFEIDNAPFVQVIDNIESYLYFSKNRKPDENNGVKVIRELAPDTDLF